MFVGERTVYNYGKELRFVLNIDMFKVFSFSVVSIFKKKYSPVLKAFKKKLLVK